jgi:hypothetical protein
VVIHLPFATPTNRPKKVPMSEGNPLALVVDDEVQIRRSHEGTALVAPPVNGAGTDPAG